ncbi:MAG: DEAD/DEAH box family ATP-dependent RNA helicase [Oligoflexia bacterium]|nr:MAG: DEAD/DEAH box family ATP-dependent RNA helicase [Oligoflexia bacterium]
MHFSDLKLIAPLQQALQETGYIQPTPIQRQAIPILLEGHDLLGIAQTGTGKTAAFSLPMLQYLDQKRTQRTPKAPRALILTPTRELAIQIHKSLLEYGKHLKQKYAVIFGGVGQGNQVRDLSQGVDVLVATPGRLLDLIEQRHLRLDKVEIFVLDEADRMLDMGFMRDIRKILPLLPQKRHNLFFSATMPHEIQKLAHSILVNPKKVEVTPPSTTVERIKQSLMFVEKKDKLDLLTHLLQNNLLYKVLIFVEMKHVANKVAEKLEKNKISAAAIHGNKSQGARQKAIEDFSKDKVRVLVATDIASRGIDIDGITHVINFELPNVPETYVHRIGRTARAGTEGEAISFCCAEEKFYLMAIEKETRQKVPVNRDHPYHSEDVVKAAVFSPHKAKEKARADFKRQSRGRRPGGRKGGPRRPRH